MSEKTKNIGLFVLAAIMLLIAIWIGCLIFLVYSKLDYSTASPVLFIKYFYYYGNNEITRNALIYSFLGGLGGLILVLLPFFLLFVIPKKISLHGKARLATEVDIKKSGLYGDNGIIIGKKGSKYLIFGGTQHVMVAAPTRGGKGVGIVIPNLLSWNESVVVLDIKQENWDITSGFRKIYGQECYLFNPMATDQRTHRYNPLFYISTDKNLMIDDISKIGDMLFPDKDGTDPIWTATPRSLFLGIVLLLIETKRTLTIGEVRREIARGGDVAKYLSNTIKMAADTKKPLSNTCIAALNSFIGITAETTRGGIIGGFLSKLELWLNPIVDAATSGNDFDLSEVRKKKMSIYIGVTPNNLNRAAPLINLFIQQLVDLNTRELPDQNKDLKYTCLMLMDEFTAVGKMNVLSKGISYIAGYNLRMLPIIQSPSQLVEVYGKETAKTFEVNHAVQVVFPPKATEVENAKSISEWLGYDTVKGVSESKGKGFGKKTPTESRSDQKRALMLPQEIINLGGGKEIIVIENTPPIICEKVVYYKDVIFQDRLQKASKTLNKLKRRAKPNEIMQAIRNKEMSADVPFLEILAESSSITVQSAFIDNMIEKVITAQDLDDIKNKSLRDFNLDFSNALIPNKEILEDVEAESIDTLMWLQEYSESLFSSIRSFKSKD